MIESAYVFAGALTGFVVGLTGVGGGALMTPILLFFFGINPAVAIATDLWFALLTKVVAALVHNKGGQVDWQVAKRLWCGSLPMTALGVLLVSLGARSSIGNILSVLIGLAVMVTAVGLVFAPRLLASARGRRIDSPDKFKSLQPQLTVAGGAFLGLCVSLTSVGAGALGCVMLLYLYPLRMTSHRLIATDIVHAIPLALFAGLGYLFLGYVNFQMLLSLLVGSIPAVIAGSLLTKKISGRKLQLALSFVLMLAGAKVILSVV